MNILIGVTGGIAAYKALELVRHFVKNKHDVQVVMTRGAKEFIQPLSFQALSGKPVRDSLFDENQEAGMGHIELARWPDVIVIAPASAETLAKLRVGRADDLLMTLCLATDKPIWLAPAMNRLMWANAATQENVSVLKQRGFNVMEPGEGEQACGETGSGRLPDPIHIYRAVVDFLHPKTSENAPENVKNNLAWSQQQAFWQGKRLLITAGPTQEPIDPVRYIGNRSSGKMGFALAQVALNAGANVTLVCGPVNLPTPVGANRIDVITAEEMFDAVKTEISNAEKGRLDVMIATAAVADYRVAEPAAQKLKKQPDQESMTLTLVKNPDIVAWVAKQKKKPFVVGFAAETQQVLPYARQKRIAKQLDMICANQVGDGLAFGQDDNALTLITEGEERALVRSSKQEQAILLLTFVSERL